jgi:hypothetical protein
VHALVPPAGRSLKPRRRRQREKERQLHFELTLSASRAKSLLRAEDRIAVELAIRPAGVAPAVVAGTLRHLYRESAEGTSHSCTTSYDGVSASLSGMLTKGAGRRQIAMAIAWLKSRNWLEVLSGGPGGGCYAIQWQQINADVDAVRTGPSISAESPREQCGTVDR